MNTIPPLDLVGQYQQMGDEITQAVAAVLASGAYIGGPVVETFEQQFATYVGVSDCVACNSGTDALLLALRALDIGPGDEVITTPLSWVATANVIVRHGARPVFVDVDPNTRLIDLREVERAIGPRTRAIIPVDLAGMPVDRDQLRALAQAHGLRVIEDAAQSMGTRWNGHRIGSFGDLVCVSFHANKNITTAEGGCLVLNDEDEATRCERLRLQGVVRLPDGGQEVEVAGAKLNMTDIAARIGLGQLARLEEFNARR
ncbi:DegT/DnrJ/EryC1/StrS family aminotransferase, partial [Trichothermofontia sp.]